MSACWSVEGVEVLKLKKLQILGFKSFCDRTELRFHGDGVAAIVGPNGCGKSNISDAISWVLGEQSAKSMRGIKMEDVIFAGTRDRKPTGMAEVTLTLIDPEVYDGAVGLQPEIDIQDELKDDWDEAELRSKRAEETEQAIEEVRPGVVLNDDADGTEAAASEGGEAASAEGSEQASAEGSDKSEKPEGVVLRIRRRKFNAQSRAGEISVTRRLFRSGESEYLLNGKLCRLRDIQDIFMGTGLGPESYAIIGQERIGQLLSSKPHDRRAIIEEAAGITRFKTKKRLAELRLEQSKQNLARVNDIFEEVTRQMASLKRQAAKAERYAALRDEMRARLRIVLASKIAQMDAEHAKFEEEIASFSHKIDEHIAQIEALDTEHTAGMQRGYELDAAAKESQTRASQSAVELERATSRQNANSERITELQSRSAA